MEHNKDIEKNVHTALLHTVMVDVDKGLTSSKKEIKDKSSIKAYN